MNIQVIGPPIQQMHHDGFAGITENLYQDFGEYNSSDDDLPYLVPAPPETYLSYLPLKTAPPAVATDKYSFSPTEHPKAREWVLSSDCELKTLPVPLPSQRSTMAKEIMDLEEEVLE